MTISETQTDDPKGLYIPAFPLRLNGPYLPDNCITSARLSFVKLLLIEGLIKISVCIEVT